MAYMNLLSQLNCNNCPNKSMCFLQHMPLQNYPETTQSFVIYLPSEIFGINETDHRRHADYHQIAKRLIAYYDTNRCSLPDNRKIPWSEGAQKDSDRQFIRDRFKHLLSIAAKATEDTAPAASILFDGIGIVLASDYLEVVHKVLSMFSTYDKAVSSYGGDCPHYSAGF